MIGKTDEGPLDARRGRSIQDSVTDEIAKAVFGLLFASSTEALFIVDRDTDQIVSANVRLAELLAYEVGAVVGCKPAAFLADPERDVSSPGRYEDVEFRRGDDFPLFVELEVVLVDDPVYGRLTAYMARDTGVRRLLEQELVAKHSALFAAYADLERACAALEDAKRQLEIRNREVALLALRAGVGELVAGIAHHLNNPVGALASTLRRLAVEVGYLPAPQRAVLDRLLVRAEQVSRRIESNVNAIVRASQATASRESSTKLELPNEVANALASFVGRLDDIPTKEPS